MEIAGSAERSVALRLWRRIYVFLALAAASTPWLPKWVPTQDGPQQLRLSEFVIEMRTDPSSPLHAVYHDSLGAVTGSIFTWFCYLLHPVVGVAPAERIWLSLCIVGFAWVGWSITRIARPDAPARALLLAPFFLSGFVTSGFFPYVASVPLAAGGILLLASRSFDKRLVDVARGILASALLLACALAHVSSLALALGLVTIGLAVRRSPLSQVLISMLVFAPALLVVAHSARVLGVVVSSHQMPISEILEFRSPIETIGYFFVYVLAGVGSLDRGVQLVVLAFALALTLAAVVLRVQPAPVENVGDRRVIELDLSRPMWPLGVLLLLGLALFVLPTTIGGWHHASARIIPFMLLMLPAATWWPSSGSLAERRLSGLVSVAAAVVVVSIGYGWREIGEHLDHVARAASVMRRGSRVLPLVFEAGSEASPAVRDARATLELHSWAIPARLRRAMVPFGFENLRRLMLVARADAHPPFPPGPDEFAARILWGPPPRTVRVYADYGLEESEITDAARFILPRVADPHFYDALRDAVLDEAFVTFHYLLAVDPPAAFRATVRGRGWPCLYDSDGVYVYELGMEASQDSLGYVSP